jgi:hypothetical protein
MKELVESSMTLAAKAHIWQSVVWLLCLLVLFLPAGTLAWLQGWMFFLAFFGFVYGLSIWLLRKKPSLLNERLQIFSQDQIKSQIPICQLFCYVWHEDFLFS